MSIDTLMFVVICAGVGLTALALRTELGIRRHDARVLERAQRAEREAACTAKLHDLGADPHAALCALRRACERERRIAAMETRRKRRAAE